MESYLIVKDEMVLRQVYDFSSTKTMTKYLFIFVLIILITIFIIIYSSLHTTPILVPNRRFHKRLPLLPEDDPYIRYGNRVDIQMIHIPSIDDVASLIYQQDDSTTIKRDSVLRDCPIKCMISNRDEAIDKAGVLVFTPDFLDRIPLNRNPIQLWVIQLLESPLNTPNLIDFNEKINYTSSYRWDSDFVSAYGRYVKFHTPLPRLEINDHKKSKGVAWFVSHCLTSNNRMEYARELSRHIDVDIYGECGVGYRSTSEMSNLLQNDYHFYLAFENSNCEDYITEKLFDNALKNDVIPIVMGARKNDYIKIAPPGSFIHVDDFESPAHLALYLNKLMNNKTLYRQYFEWKRFGRIQSSNFLCRLCLFMNNPRPKIYNNMDEWWHGRNECSHVPFKTTQFIQ